MGIVTNDIESAAAGKNFEEVGSFLMGGFWPEVGSSVTGSGSESMDVLSSVTAVNRQNVDVDSFVASLLGESVNSFVIAKEGSIQVWSALSGGAPDTFGLSFPLSDKLPLRKTNVWGNYADVKVIPHVYGQATIKPIQYDQYGKEFVIADHAISEILEVKGASTYSFKNKVDELGHPISVISFDTVANIDDIILTIIGKIHPDYGHVMENPADVVWDILRNIAGIDIEYSLFDQFRTECQRENIKVAGVVDDADITIRSQIDEIMTSIGAVWSGGMPNFARIYPVPVS